MEELQWVKLIATLGKYKTSDIGKDSPDEVIGKFEEAIREL